LLLILGLTAKEKSLNGAYLVQFAKPNINDLCKQSSTSAYF